MNKLVISSAIFLLALTTQARAGLPDEYFGTGRTSLVQNEQKAVNISKGFQDTNIASSPSKSGAVQFVYGQGQIPVRCAILQICDIALETGERINNIHVGDPRFSISEAIVGKGASQQAHILVKPFDVDLDTSAVITTDKRIYHFKLRSSRDNSMPSVSFIYPEVQQAITRAAQQEEDEMRDANTLRDTGEYLGDLDFNYKLVGNAAFKPVRVYNDGRKTILQMPKDFHQTEAPALLVLKGGTGMFSKAEELRVNYRVQSTRYIVDGVFEKAALIAGVGSSQQKITIIHKR